MAKKLWIATKPRYFEKIKVFKDIKDDEQVKACNKINDHEEIKIA